MTSGQEFFHILCDELPDGMGYYQEHRWVYVNGVMEAMFGFEKGAMTGALAWEKIDSDHLDRVKRMAVGRSCGSITDTAIYEIAIETQNGSRWLGVTSKTILFDGKSGGLVVATDITDKKLLQQRLAEVEQKFRRMFQKHSAVMMLINPQTAAIEDANESALKFYGFTTEQLLGMKITDLNVMPPVEVAFEMQKALNEKRNYFNFKHRLADGRIRDVEVHSSPIGYHEHSTLFSIIYDITEKKHTEDTLLRQEALLQKLNENLEQKVHQEAALNQQLFERFKNVFENSSVGICLTHGDGEFVEVNPAFATILGYAAEELLHVGFTDIAYGDEKTDVKNMFEALKDGFLEFVQFDKRFLTKSGSIVYLNIVLSLFKDSMDNSPLFLAVCQNITEKKIIEEKQKEQERMMLQQSRLVTMGEMIGNIAHQWRQPLNAVGLLVQDTLDAYRYGELDEKYLRRNVNESMDLLQFMSKTIDDFRNLFRLDKQKKEFSLSEELQKVVSFVEAGYKNHDIKVELTIDEESVIDGYPGEFAQVVLNLLGNARDAIETRQKKDGLIRIKLFRDGERAVLSIKDNGGGIPDGVCDRIFEPYFTTKEQGKGTGMGLYMSKMIIEENMHGKISVGSVDDGAEFRVEL